jgi:hypothetical protein
MELVEEVVVVLMLEELFLLLLEIHIQLLLDLEAGPQ